jgi:hypothetical protein
MRELPPALVERLRGLNGVVNVEVVPEGLLQRVVVEAHPDPQLRERVLNLVGVESERLVESVLEREPMLEEAYLNILRVARRNVAFLERRAFVTVTP